MGSAGEVFRPAFPQENDIDGNPLYQYVSYGLTHDASCAKHVRETYHCKRAYIVASNSLSKQTSHVRNLEKALASTHLKTWVGIRPHTPWEDLVPIINDMREKQADCLITIGGGSLIDGAKIIILVSIFFFSSLILRIKPGSRKRCLYYLRPRSLERQELSRCRRQQTP